MSADRLVVTYHPERDDWPFDATFPARYAFELRDLETGWYVRAMVPRAELGAAHGQLPPRYRDLAFAIIANAIAENPDDVEAC